MLGFHINIHNMFQIPQYGLTVTGTLQGNLKRLKIQRNAFINFHLHLKKSKKMYACRFQRTNILIVQILCCPLFLLESV